MPDGIQLGSLQISAMFSRVVRHFVAFWAIEIMGTREHWRAFYGRQRYCLADLVALERPDKLGSLYPEFTISAHGFGFGAENWCVMPKLGNQLYLAIYAGPIHDEDGSQIALVETLRDLTDQKRAELALKTLTSSDGVAGLANRRRSIRRRVSSGPVRNAPKLLSPYSRSLSIRHGLRGREA